MTEVPIFIWANFTMGSNEQHQHFAELRQKVCLNIQDLVLQRGLQQKMEKAVAANKIYTKKQTRK